jgi:hypothetical protein
MINLLQNPRELGQFATGRPENLYTAFSINFEELEGWAFLIGDTMLQRFEGPSMVTNFLDSEHKTF